MSESKPAVGIVGMGRMGSAMAGTLTAAGHDVVVTNRTPDRAEAVAAATGARAVATPGMVAAQTSVVISILADDAAVEASYLGEDGIVAGLGAGDVVLEMSTIDPSTVARLRPEVEAVGADLVDAPVSGSVALVEQGKLTVMAAGPGDAIGRARPVLESLAATIFEVGPSGAGATVKLAVNGLVHAINIALSEALVLAEKAGVDRSLAYDVFAGGAAGAPFLQYKRSAFLEPDATPVAFSLDLVAKDLSLILGLADRVGAPMSQAAAGLAIVRSAIGAGRGSDDMSVVATHLRG
jgi:3-hydroxyisobutyrate dehydrogenase-like beta-hydroxyacid dehydrogenase